MTRHDGCKVLVCHYFHVQSFSNYREVVLRDLAVGSLIPDILPLVYTFAFEFTFHYTDRDLVIADRDVHIRGCLLCYRVCKLVTLDTSVMCVYVCM